MKEIADILRHRCLDTTAIYTTINIKDELAQIPGVGDVSMFGQQDYSLRVWLDPDKVAARTGLSQAEARRAIDAMLQSVSDQLAAGGEVSLPGFGKFSVSRRAARQGRNPSTGESIRLSASRAAKFSAASSLKKRLNNYPQAGGSGGEPDDYSGLLGDRGDYPAAGLSGEPDE